MSGGHWNYQSHRIRELLGGERESEIAALLEVVADTERLIDWAISGDTLKEEEMSKLWSLWEGAFDTLYGGEG